MLDLYNDERLVAWLDSRAIDQDIALDPTTYRIDVVDGVKRLIPWRDEAGFDHAEVYLLLQGAPLCLEEPGSGRRFEGEAAVAQVRGQIAVG